MVLPVMQLLVLVIHDLVRQLMAVSVSMSSPEVRIEDRSKVEHVRYTYS